MIKAVIFDNDGVIVNSIPLHFEVWKRLMAEHGVEISQEEFDRINGMVTPKILRLWRDKFNLDYDIEEMAHRKRKMSDEVLREKVELFDGVPDFLKLLKKNGIKTAIATSAYLSTIKIILDRHPIRQYFDAVVTMEDYEKGKPAPDVFLKAAEKIGIGPGQCAVIEDAQNGVKAAKAAGMKCIAVTTSFSRDKLWEADLIVDSLKEVDMAVLEKL